MPELYEEISNMICPSDVYGKVEAYRFRCARGSYATCRGDRYSDINYRATGSNADRKTRGVFSCGNIWIRMGSISDGTSNTISISEAVSAEKEGSTSIRGGQSDLDVTVGTTPLTNCVARYDTDRTQLTSPKTDGRRQCVLFSGISSSFNTVLPPNMIACSNGWTLASAIVPPQSYHPGGVNCGRVDGSAMFVSDTINARTAGGSEVQPSATDGGKSPYGVWGALGTIDGGETITL